MKTQKAHIYGSLSEKEDTEVQNFCKKQKIKINVFFIITASYIIINSFYSTLCLQ